ncbi:hypothetical protein AVEN_192141-1 [Araneus ventricosus]|uniref:Uncharacterized protein n=1 Tax=Araneus ventricosus TaxID=182803 RepID=A0A4Y2LLI3_ARAVE|nr:hypothetical protein AVEN_192141-1 [Araneus ventricosus]
MDAKDLKSPLACSMKYEAARIVSKTSRHVRSIEMEDHMSREKDDKFEFLRGKLDASIECGSRKFYHRIYVADITDPCILGLDFIQKFNFTVDLEKNKLRKGGEEILLFSASIQHSKSCSVLSKERTIIPARSECLIQGVPEVPGQFRYDVTNFPSQTSQKSILVAATLVDLEMEAVPVRVLNLNNKPKILDKGHVIANCEPVWISSLVLKNFLEHNIYRQPWRIFKYLMKNNEQQ